MAVVKADGYGHGLVPAARAVLAGGADSLGVAVLEEALALRAAGVTAPVLAWLHGPGHRLRRRAGRRRRGVGERGLGAGRGGRRGAGHRPDRAGAPQGRHRALPRWRDAGRTGPGWSPRPPARRPTGTSPSSGCGATWPTPTRPRTPRSAAQVRVFEEALAIARDAGLTDARRHLANSAATVALPDTWYDLVRPGIALYGLDPLGGDPAAHGLRPAMTVRAGVALTKRVPAGVGVSYGHTYFPDRETTLALVPVGYADGVPRAAGNRAPVLAGGEQRTIAGRVCMDQFVLDVGDAAGGSRRRGRPVGHRASAASRRRSSGPTPSTPSTTSWSPGSAGASPAATSARRGRSDGARHPEAEAAPGTTPRAHRRASSGRCSDWPRPAPPRGWRSAASPRVASGRPSSGGKALADARLREDDPLGGAVPGGRPDGAGAGRRRRAAVGRGDRPAGRAADRRLRARLHAVDGVLGLPAADARRRAGDRERPSPGRAAGVLRPARARLLQPGGGRPVDDRAAGPRPGRRDRGAGAVGAGGPGRALDGRHDDHGARGAAAGAVRAEGGRRSRCSPPRAATWPS